MILEVKKYGWANINIGNDGSIFKGRVSYLRDTPLEMLETFKLYVDSNIVPTIKCDEEGSEFLIVVDKYTTHIISERDSFQYYNWDISCKDFICQVIKDIEMQIENVVMFMDDEIEDRKNKIEKLILYIKEHLK